MARQIAGFLALNLLLLIAVAIAANSLIIATRGLRFDFYPHYVGGRAVWQGENPYDQAITEQIQLGMFGQRLPPEADQQNMAYPAYASVVLGPVLLLPAQMAIALWMAVQFCAILWTPVLWTQILDWLPPPLVLGGLVLALVFVFRYPMDLFVLAQFSGTVLLAYSAGVWLLLNGRDAAAGVVLAFATIPPTMGLPLALALLVAVLLRGRWRGLAAFAGTLLLLTLVSFLLAGLWLPDYLAILTAYQDYAVVVWAPQAIAWPVLRWLFIAGLLLLSLVMLWRWWRAGTDAAFIDLALTALPVSLLLIPQTGEYYLVLLIPVIVAVLYQATRLTLLPALVIIAASLLLVISPWLYPRVEGFILPNLLIPLHGLAVWSAARWLSEVPRSSASI